MPMSKLCVNSGSVSQLSEAEASANQASIIAAGLEVSEISPQSKTKAAAGAVATGSTSSTSMVII